MKGPAPLIIEWPNTPELPVPGQTVLVHVAPARTRAEARLELRRALRQILVDWSGLPKDRLPLRETRCGPSWPGRLAGHTLGISLAYAGNEGWMGLIRGQQIGIDVMPLEAVPEAESVARLYLGPAAVAGLQQAVDPVAAFAASWTALEARLKCLKAGLLEWTPVRDAAQSMWSCQSLVFASRLAIAVATAASGPEAPGCKFSWWKSEKRD